jgi:hypothetical protein
VIPVNETLSRNQTPVSYQNATKIEAVERLLETAFRAKLGEAALMIPGQFKFWEANSLGLDQCVLFRRLHEADQDAILFDLSQNLLNESFFIESAAITTATKLSLTASSLQERMFFSLMAGEEALHLRALLPFMARPARIDESPLGKLFSRVSEQGSREVLLLLVQVVLEGWALSHYSKIAKGCQNDLLAQALRQIVQDESRHHGMGLVLSSPDNLNTEDLQFVSDAIYELLSFARTGPAPLLSVLVRRLGQLSVEEKRMFLEQSRAQLETQMRLELMKSLLKGVLPMKMLANFEESGLFRAISNAEAAEIQYR